MRKRHWFSEWYGVIFGATLDFTSWRIGFNWWPFSHILVNCMVVNFYLGPIELSISFRKDELCK